jgi:hypothetical protein
MVVVHIGLSEIKGPEAPKPEDHRAMTALTNIGASTLDLRLNLAYSTK